MKAFHYAPGWLDQVPVGRPYRLTKGVEVKDQVSRKKLREHGELHTVAAVAERVKMNPQTIYEWIERGDSRGRKLECFRVGRHIRISDEQLETFLTGGSAGGPAKA